MDAPIRFSCYALGQIGAVARKSSINSAVRAEAKKLAKIYLECICQIFAIINLEILCISLKIIVECVKKVLKKFAKRIDIQKVVSTTFVIHFFFKKSHAPY